MTVTIIFTSKSLHKSNLVNYFKSMYYSYRKSWSLYNKNFCFYYC